ncbi:MAG: hypothetical protein LW645_13655 [Verrucomicrobiaceae bacterium]|nr:hypothetical protein [Verrucomicrobiaceae bacterium]
MKRLLLLPALLALGAHSAAEETKSKFIRFAEEEASDSLQTAVVTYESPQQVQVDLVGAVHIADKAYFDGLNTRFKTYDAVLYELVGPPMEERVEGIDYQAKNFVHADMNMKQFTKTQETKKESFLTLYLKAVQAQKSANAKKGLDSDTAGLVMLLKVFTAKDSSSGLKRMIAQEFDSVEDIMAGVEAGDGTVLVGERNRVALEVMDKQIAAGKRRLAIFYGAAHLADMEERLLKKGFKRTQTEWLKAWNLPHEE